MKRLAILLLIIFIVALTTIAQSEPRAVRIFNFTTGTIAASGSFTSPVMELDRHEGFFSTQTKVTGSGTASISYQLSNNGSDWTTATSIATGITAAAVNLSAYTPTVTKYQRFVITETGGANSVSVEVWAANQ